MGNLYSIPENFKDSPTHIICGDKYKSCFFMVYPNPIPVSNIVIYAVRDLSQKFILLNIFITSNQMDTPWSIKSSP